MAHDRPIRVDHVGIAVESISEAEPVLTALGCEKLTEETVENRFRWAYYQLGSASRLELIEPTAEESFLTDFLDRYGPGLHHVTLEVADIKSVITEIEATGLRVVEYEEYDDWTEAFVSRGIQQGHSFNSWNTTRAMLRSDRRMRRCTSTDSGFRRKNERHLCS